MQCYNSEQSKIGDGRGDNNENSDLQDLLNGNVLLRDVKDDGSIIGLKISDAVVDGDKRKHVS